MTGGDHRAARVDLCWRIFIFLGATAMGLRLPERQPNEVSAISAREFSEAAALE